MRRLTNLTVLMLILPLYACEAEPKRGPASAPVSWVESSRLQFDEAADPAAGPISVEPLAESDEQREQMPAALALRDAFASTVAPNMAVALVSGSLAKDTAEVPLALVVELSLDDYEPALVTAADGTDGVTLLTQSGADLVLGSPFVAEFSPLQPLGLLQVDGELINALQPHGYTRVLGFDEGQIGVVGRGAFHRGLFASALQVGPGILEQGQLDISTRELKLPAYFRTFLVSCQQSVLVGASTRPVHLRTLGSALLQFAAERKLRCDEAVNLSGDREVLLGVRSGAQAVVLGNPRVKKTALIGFRPRPLSSP